MRKSSIHNWTASGNAHYLNPKTEMLKKRNAQAAENQIGTEAEPISGAAKSAQLGRNGVTGKELEFSWNDVHRSERRKFIQGGDEKPEGRPGIGSPRISLRA
jgi:hypothetical protein